MRGDFGYMEEGKLGKPYNLALLKRLSGYIKPFRKAAAGVLFLTVILTLLDLAFPYMTKVAIDRYILSKSRSA